MSLALYRTYRPGSFADVIGQDHVTGPLMRALAADRVHHAYLFSGPRGCGKTSSARILARSLNCEQGPTAEPCGTCQSCIDLAPNGPGSLDVIELDAASNRGIDQARELRERAMYAPASARYRIYIIDEAHQLTSEAANALLKLVEEPPPHLRFVFATTEPEKLLGTIRSRTHHYPFRLVPTDVLTKHLARLCELEGVKADPAALALAAKAGAGSVRDALSVLGQLVGGAGLEGITYDAAVAQLGFTSDALLDTIMGALAEQDGAALFKVIEEVVSAGHDPRRFATDLLERLRDLIILQAAPSAAEHGLVHQPADRLAALSEQAGLLGSAALSRAADIVSDGITALRGATAPRLHLELLAARLLVAAGDAEVSSILTRLDQLERKLAQGVPMAAAPAAAPVAAPEKPARPAPPTRLSDLRQSAKPAEAAEPASAASDDATSEPVVEQPAADPVPGPVESQSAEPGVDLASIQALWPAVVEAARAKAGPVAAGALGSTWPVSADEASITVAFANQGAMAMAQQRKFDQLITQCVLEVAGRKIAVAFVHDASIENRRQESRGESLSPQPLSQAQPAPVVEALPSEDDAEADPRSGAEEVAEMLGGVIVEEYEEKPKKK